MDYWALALRSKLCPQGQPHGHPTCRGPLTVSSGIWAWCPEEGWARTLSRYYRLGRRRDEAGATRQ